MKNQRLFPFKAESGWRAFCGSLRLNIRSRRRKHMPDSDVRSEKSDNANAQKRAREALERGVAEIKTPDQARHALDSLEKIAGDLREVDVARAGSDATPEQQAAAIEEAEDVPAVAKPASVIAAAAAQSAKTAPGGKAIIDDPVNQALGGGGESDAPPSDTRRGRRHLRHELFQRLHPLQAVDAFAFVQINQIPHTRLLDRFMTGLSWVMTGGTGWLLFLLLATLVDRQRGWKATRAVVPSLWLATTTVEHPIKKWFRRRRPFVSLIEAIIVGRKPGSYSFPSGHSAAAFAGALLLAREYPARARGFFGLASLVAFSRIYLGVHYPGDVLSGSLLGMVLAKIYWHFLRKIGLTPK
jgi:undecaprenyl-diphosphatase